MAQLPLHMQVLVHLRDQVKRRKAQHEARCGKGLVDQDYQRHVGRIQECDASLEAIQELMKSGLNDVEDHDEEVDERNANKATRRTARRDRITQ